MRLALFAIAIAASAIVATPKADARPFWEASDRAERSYTSQRHKAAYRKKSHKQGHYRSGRSKRYASMGGGRSGGVGPRPRRWCGWWMRTQLGGGPEFNLARNWRKWGRPAGGPQVGAVVVWSSHVGMITGRASNGKWIVKSGNDGGRVRERARSVAGAVFRVG